MMGRIDDGCGTIALHRLPCQEGGWLAGMRVGSTPNRMARGAIAQLADVDPLSQWEESEDHVM